MIHKAPFARRLPDLSCMLDSRDAWSDGTSVSSDRCRSPVPSAGSLAWIIGSGHIGSGQLGTWAYKTGPGCPA